MIFNFFFFSFLNTQNRPKPKTLRLNEKISVATNGSFSTSSDENFARTSSSISFFDFRRHRRRSPSLVRMTVTVDGEDLSDSGIDKACDDTSSVDRPTAVATTPTNNFDDDFVRNEQLRPHNQQPPPNSTSINVENSSIECQQNSNGGGLNGQSVNRSNSITNDMNKIIRMNSHPAQFRESHGGQSNNQFTPQHEHHTTLPFSSNTYAAFKKGNVVRGILCPSLTNSFR